MLSEQQHRYLSHHLASISTRLITGSDNTHLWSTQEVWDNILDVNLIVSTPQVLLEGLERGFVQLQRISLLIIDEAHHCIAKHPSNITMQSFYHQVRRTNSGTQLPCILGLTASPIHRKLENMDTLERNLDAVCISPTQQIEEYRKYVHLPQIVGLDYILRCSPPSLPIQLMSDITESIDINEDPWIKHLSKGKRSGDLHKRAQALESRSTFSMDQLKKLKGNTLHLQDQLGTWATNFWLREILLKLHVKVKCNDWLVNISEEEHCYLDEVLSQIRELSCEAVEEGNIIYQLSSKAECLVQFLVKEYAEDVNISCVIFVERRSTAYALAKLLQNHPAISCTVASFVGGSNSGKKTNLIDLADITTQRTELEEFRSGMRSIVVATSVVEEGIDIQATNLVVLFDHALTVRSYIQRRGRARKVASKFVIMRSNDELNLKYTEFKTLEASMKAQFQNEMRQMQTRIDLEDQDEASDYVYAINSTGAQLTFENARNLLEHYCQSLSKVPYEPNPRPTFICQILQDSTINAKVVLPSSLPAELKEVTGVELWRTEKMAKRDAAYQAVKKLHEKGLINDHLLPPMKAKRYRFTIEQRTSVAEIRPLMNPWLPISCEADENMLLHVHRLEISARDVCRNHASSIVSESPKQLSSLLLLLPVKLESGVCVPLHYTTLQTLQARVSYIEDRITSIASRLVAHEVTLFLIRKTLVSQTKDPEGWEVGLPFYLLPDVPETDLNEWLDISRRGSPLAEMVKEDTRLHGQPIALTYAKTSGIYFSELKRSDLVRPESRPALAEEIPAVSARRTARRLDYLTAGQVPSSMRGRTRAVEIEDCRVLHISPSIVETMQFVPSVLRIIGFALIARSCCKDLLRSLDVANDARLMEALTSPQAVSSPISRICSSICFCRSAGLYYRPLVALIGMTAANYCYDHRLPCWYRSSLPQVYSSFRDVC